MEWPPWLYPLFLLACLPYKYNPTSSFFKSLGLHNNYTVKIKAYTAPPGQIIVVQIFCIDQWNGIIIFLVSLPSSKYSSRPLRWFSLTWLYNVHCTHVYYKSIDPGVYIILCAPPPSATKGKNITIEGGGGAKICIKKIIYTPALIIQKERAIISRFVSFVCTQC